VTPGLGLAAALALTSLGACKEKAPPPDAGSDEKVAPPALPPETEAPAPGPKFVHAPTSGPVADIVLRELAAAGAEDRELLVYVGADWCEPCKRFHAAVEAGELDEAFPKLTLVEFDAGNDRDRLIEAGYGSRLVPLFAAPGPDGTDSGRRFEGSVKGPAAIENIVPRLEKLLELARADRGSWPEKGERDG
jgi:thiol-disulfide isomerase/thioredoxin